MNEKERIEYKRAQNRKSQHDRRKREKQWLETHGYTSWENVHTQLMNGKYKLEEVRKVKEPR